jgi:hypothetical protein
MEEVVAEAEVVVADLEGECNLPTFSVEGARETLAASTIEPARGAHEKPFSRDGHLIHPGVTRGWKRRTTT